MTVRFCTSMLRSICTGLGVVVHGAQCHRLGTRVRTCPVRQMQKHERDSRPPAGGRLLAERALGPERMRLLELEVSATVASRLLEIAMMAVNRQTIQASVLRLALSGRPARI
jgi:hypothetical protein